MAHLRYVRNPAHVPARRPGLECTVRSLRVRYETDPEIHAALLPRPLQPSARPEIFIQHANVSMHVRPGQGVDIGAATVGVKCSFEGTEGNRVTTVIARHGIAFLEMRGEIGESLAVPAPFMEYFFCHKALPRIDGADGFDGPVLLTRLNWQRNYSDVKRIHNPQVILRESAYDPLIDVPVRRIVEMQLAEGATQTSGQILAEIPGEYLVNHIHQRYDDGIDIGMDLDLASERKVVNA